MPKVFVSPKYRALAVVAIFLMVAGFAFKVVKAQPANYDMKLSTPTVTVDENGRTIVTMMATGDLAGPLTMALTTNPDGMVSGGEWALIVSSTVVTQGTPEPGGDPDGQSEGLVQKGVLKGNVGSGTIKWNENGSVASISGVSLNVTGGTFEYDGVSGGSGSTNGYNLTDRANSDGTLALTF